MSTQRWHSWRQQIDFGEETGPRIVVSGLVKYIPIEEMRDKYLVGVVSCSSTPPYSLYVADLTRTSIVQPQAS